MIGKILPVILRASCALSIPLAKIVYDLLNTYKTNVHNLSTFVDDMMPFNKFFSVPYYYWFGYVFIVLMFFAVVDYKYYFKLLSSIIVGMFISYIVFYFFQTTVPRPEVIGNDIFARLMRSIYASDAPYNCFPSIHVLNALLATVFFCKYNKALSIRIFAWASCIVISLSTIYTKQHYFLDVVGGVFLGLFMYFLFTNEYLWSRIPLKRVLYYIMPARAKNNYTN